MRRLRLWSNKEPASFKFESIIISSTHFQVIFTRGTLVGCTTVGDRQCMYFSEGYRMLGMQSGTPRDARIFEKMNIINIITNTYSGSIKAIDT